MSAAQDRDWFELSYALKEDRIRFVAARVVGLALDSGVPVPEAGVIEDVLWQAAGLGVTARRRQQRRAMHENIEWITTPSVNHKQITHAFVPESTLSVCRHAWRERQVTPTPETQKCSHCVTAIAD